MSTRKKIQELMEATADGKAVLAEGGNASVAARNIEAALEELGGVGPDWADEVDDAAETLTRLQAKLSRLDDATVRAIPPCRGCGSTELLLADVCWIDGLYIAHGKTELMFAMIACPHCGDTRMWTPTPAKLRDARNELDEACFRAITVPGGERGPFR